MYLIIKTNDFGTAGKNYSVAGQDVDRSNAIAKKLALDTLNENKKQVSYALWSSDHGNLDIDAEQKQNGAEQEGGQVYE